MVSLGSCMHSLRVMSATPHTTGTTSSLSIRAMTALRSVLLGADYMIHAQVNYPLWAPELHMWLPSEPGTQQS